MVEESSNEVPPDIAGAARDQHRTACEKGLSTEIA
jgi:hypothetical protein